MAVFNEPTKWQTSLVNSGDANTIPQTTPAGTGKASFKAGFPQITQVPIGAGGIAPDRKDFNGLFKILGDWIFFAQNGGVPSYNNSYDYAIGRVVLYNSNIYKCIRQNGPSSTVIAPTNTNYWSKILSISDLSGYVTNPVNADLIFNNALRILRNDNDKYLIFVAGNDSSTSSSITISGTTHQNHEGDIILIARDSNRASSVFLRPDGTLTKDGKKIITQPDIDVKANTDLSNINNTAKIAIAHNAMPSSAYDTLTVGASGTTYTAPADGYAYASGTVDGNSLWSFVDLSASTGISSRCLATTGALGMKVFIPLRKGQQFNFNYANANNLTLTFKYAVGSESEQ